MTLPPSCCFYFCYELGFRSGSSQKCNLPSARRSPPHQLLTHLFVLLHPQFAQLSSASSAASTMLPTCLPCGLSSFSPASDSCKFIRLLFRQSLCGTSLLPAAQSTQHIFDLELDFYGLPFRNLCWFLYSSFRSATIFS